MKYATIDQNGAPIAFYSEDVHGPKLIPDPAFDLSTVEEGTTPDIPLVPNPDCKIPADAVEIPDEIWSAHINGDKHIYDATAGGWVKYVPSVDELLNAAKSTKLSEIKAAYEAAIVADIAYMNTTFQADAKSQDLIVKTLSASGGTLPNGFFWVDSANNQVPMTYADLQGLANAILLRGQQAFAKYQALKAQVNAATTVDEVNAINVAI